MDCGCAGGGGGGGGRAADVDGNGAVGAHAFGQREQMLREYSARRLMCMICPNRKGPAWGTEKKRPGKCGVLNVPISITIAGVKACPKGRHPDAEGIIPWMGVRWFGVPMPVRVLAVAIGKARGGISSVREVAGCGCVVVLKTRWERVKAWWGEKGLGGV